MSEKVTIKEAAEFIGGKKRRTEELLCELVEEGILAGTEEGILFADAETIRRELETFTSFYEFAVVIREGRFDGKKETHRKRLLHFLNKQEWFGLDVRDSGELLIGSFKDTKYIRTEQIPYLMECLVPYLQKFDLSEKEQYEKLLDKMQDRETTKEAIVQYAEKKNGAEGKAFTDAVRLLGNTKDLLRLENTDISKLLHQADTKQAKKILIDFLNDAFSRYPVRYDCMIPNPHTESKSLSAYDDEVYLGLARCIFNSEYIEEHDMIRKALENPLYAELWLYLSIFYACGWRGNDICDGWGYLRLYERKENVLGLSKETLYEDILYDRIPDETYENVCRYALKSIEISGRLPSKTREHSPSPLLAVITEELFGFYGLLTLIGECHRLHSMYGYMDKKRKRQYQNKIQLRDFFGNEILDLLKGQNLHARRLNKDYLQGIEQTARETGCGAVMASSVASYARNHISLDTIKIYLNDHNLTGESADMVLYFMLERGVFGFEYYQMLVTAYPDAVKKLPLSSQNRLIAILKETGPLTVECRYAEQLATHTVEDYFLEGKKESVLSILKSMYEISQCRGKAKDDGVYCLLRAEKKACPYPAYESCLGNACHNLVFTKLGYLPLLRILKMYQKKGENGDLKAKMVLKKVLIPRYQEILNRLITEINLNRREKNALVALMKEELNGKSVTGD